MRLHGAALLISSVSILSALNVLSAPLIIVDKVKAKDADDFLRSTRIGLAGAKANVRVDSHADTDADVLDPDFVRIALPNPESDHNPERQSENANEDGGADSNKMTFPELPSFVKEAMEKAKDEARKAATHIAEKEHDIEEEINSVVETDNKEDAGVHVIHCTEKSWRSKANKVENWFRKLVGLALVQRSECTEEQLPPPLQPQSQSQSQGQNPDEFVKIHVVTEENSVPVPRPAADVLNAEIIGNTGVPCHKKTGSAASGPVIAMMSPPSGRPRHRHGRLWGWRRPQTFWGRLERALYSLSPWEGRALAFVIGCGIGVLLRMVFVFIILGVRFWQRKRLQAIQLAEQDAQVTIFDVNELEEEELPPPMYNETETRVQIEKRSTD